MPVVLSPYEDLSPVARDNTPIHIPSGIPGEPSTAGTATIGTRTMPFPIQQDTAAEQQGWVKRMNEFDRVKRETEKAEQDAAYLKNLMMNQRTTGSARAVEAAMTFQAMRNYERDYNTAIAAGLSPSQASIQSIARNPGMLKGTSGAAFLNATTDYTPKRVDIPGIKTPGVQTGRTFRFAPADNSEGYTPNVIDVPGVGPVLRTGPRSSQVVRKDEVNQAQRLNALKAQASIYQKQLDSLPRDKKPPVQEKLDRVMEAIGEYNPKKEVVPSGPAVATPNPKVTVKRKSDGKVFVYPGDAGDVPLDRFDIIQ